MSRANKAKKHSTYRPAWVRLRAAQRLGDQEQAMRILVEIQRREAWRLTGWTKGKQGSRDGG